MKSLSFDDSNGDLSTQKQHATTASLSVEHSEGWDDVYEFTFATREWKQLKAPTLNHAADCKSVTNVYYNSPASPVALSFFITFLAGVIGFAFA